MAVIEKRSTSEKIGDFFKSFYYTITFRRKVWKEKLEQRAYRKKTENSKSKYIPQEADRTLAQGCIAFLKNKYPKGIRKEMEAMNLNELHDHFIQLEKDLEKLMRAKPTDVIFMQIPKSNSACVFDFKTGVLTVNTQWIIEGHTDMLEELVFQLIHNLQHVRQKAAVDVAHRIEYGYDETILHAWTENLKGRNYIYCTESDEGYRKQPIEQNAYWIEAEVKRQLSQKA